MLDDYKSVKKGFSILIGNTPVAFSKSATIQLPVEPANEKWNSRYKSWTVSFDVSIDSCEMIAIREMNNQYNGIVEIQTWSRIRRIQIFRTIHKYFPVFTVIPDGYTIDIDSLINFNNKL